MQKKTSPTMGLILGSVLGSFADELEDAVSIRFVTSRASPCPPWRGTRAPWWWGGTRAWTPLAPASRIYARIKRLDNFFNLAIGKCVFAAAIYSILPIPAYPVIPQPWYPRCRWMLPGCAARPGGCRYACPHSQSTGCALPGTQCIRRQPPSPSCRLCACSHCPAGW